MTKIIIKTSLFALLFLTHSFTEQVSAQVNQITIPRVAQMPNLPSPYLMRNWKDAAIRYDEFIFSTGSSGQFLPLMHLKTTGINYPALQPILLDTYVGSANSGNQAEAINIIPAIVGATLAGADKSNQNGINWALKSKDFFNLANGQNVYLNGYSATSGSDWWYDLMPNIFFYQLYAQYPDLPDFNEQFITVADRWLSAVHAMGGSTTPWQIPEMNYRAWKLSSMTPLNSGVIEPESAGTIAWILYHAWLKTGDKKYLSGAEMAIDFLSNLNSNPSYELQLPYGAFVAARMNAELGTHYNIEKIVNWCFDRGSLRGWGVIAGKWNGSDVSGLIGEANDAGNDYAFAMNGFQQAAALVPMVKYDKRFARDIAKWTLNLANASRLYYPKYLPQISQDDYAWSSQNDPGSVIAYEALKENLDGKKLYGTGDAKRNGWAQTNLGIYGSSHVGYLAAVVDTTDVQGILRLDMNKTDFFGDNPFPSFLVYNPYSETKQITLSLGAQTYDVYNAITETVIQTGVTGNIFMDVPAGEVMFLVYLPAGATLTDQDGMLYYGDDIVDYNFGYNFEGKLRIKSLDAMDTVVEFGQQAIVYSTIENATEPVTYNWYVNGILSASSENNFTWTVPEVAGNFKVLLEVISGSSSAKDSILFKVVENIPKAPLISGFTTDTTWYYSGSPATIICHATDEEGYPLQYNWTLPAGSLISQNDSLILWSLPLQEGLFQLSCEVTNKAGLTAVAQKQILVRKMSEGISEPLAYYPLDGNGLDHSGNGHDATVEGAQITTDFRGEQKKAYRFSSGTDIIFVENKAVLNFQNSITLSFWVKLDGVPEECFILSHGSWEERWKVSVTPEKKLRWTVKTSSGTKDLDSSFPLLLNQYYHFAVVYSGYTMELYADGVLDTFSSATGLMSVTSKALTFGRKDVAITSYFLRGSLDEVRIYNKALAPNEIETLKSLWSAITAVPDEKGMMLYPNPSNGIINVSGIYGVRNVVIMDITGRIIPSSFTHESDELIQIEFNSNPGVVIIRIETGTKVIYKKIVSR